MWGTWNISGFVPYKYHFDWQIDERLPLFSDPVSMHFPAHNYIHVREPLAKD